MPSASEFSAVPGENASIGGKNCTEGQTATQDVNDMLRYLAAVARDTFNRIPATNSFMPINGGAFTGDITRQNRGGYLHHNGVAQADGRVFFLPEGSARPTASEGAVVFYYS